jgi:hypothetical protein
MRLKWKLGSVRLEIVLLLMHDWCMVCVKRTVGSKIVLEAPDGKLGSLCLEIVLLLMHDWCTVCVKRTVGLEIVLEAPDGTPS